MNNSELKPCPFCGGEAEFVRKAIRTNGVWTDSVYVHCKNCDARIGKVMYNAKMHPLDEEYIKAERLWNRRVKQ